MSYNGKNAGNPPALQGRRTAREKGGWEMAKQVRTGADGGAQSPRRRWGKQQIVLLSLCALVVLAVVCGVLDYHSLLPKRSYTAADFGVETLRSETDRNGNGVDDFTDILEGARKAVEENPVYDNSYAAGGYPEAGRGACTDVIWRALAHAGYDLKGMVDADIALEPAAYPGAEDPNIDFRRVKNLEVFFSRHCAVLTLDPYQVADWQPGDIVTFSPSHIAIVSDKRNRDGVPYIIHQDGQPQKEEDALTHRTVTGHYRFIV